MGTVEMHHKRVDQAAPGDNVGMNVKNLDKNNMPHSGDVMIYKKDTSLSPVKVPRMLVDGKLVWMALFPCTNFVMRTICKDLEASSTRGEAFSPSPKRNCRCGLIL